MTALSSLDGRLPRFSVAVLAGACTAVLGASGAVAVSRSGATAPASAAPSPSPSPVSESPSAPPAPPRAKTVADYLVPLDSADFERVPDSVAGAGAIDLRKAAAIDSGDKTPSAKAIQQMRDAGFVRGQSRVWDNGDTTAVVYVYEWRTAGGARAFVHGVRRVHERKHDAWQTGLAYATGSCRTREGEIVDSEVLYVGRHTFIVAVLRSGTCAKHDAVARVARLQYRHAVAMKA